MPMKKIFKSTNKVLLTALLTGLLSSAGSAKLVARTFYSADKSKSFKATLTAFDEEKKQVKVRTAKGKDITFKLSVLSEECKAYVAEHASEVAVATALSISFEKVKEKKVKGVDGVNTTFDVTFYNKSETTLKDVVIDYTIYWKKGNITKGQKSTQMEEKGSFSVYDLDPKYRVTETTKAVNVVNKTIKSKGGG